MSVLLFIKKYNNKNKNVVFQKLISGVQNIQHVAGRPHPPPHAQGDGERHQQGAAVRQGRRHGARFAGPAPRVFGEIPAADSEHEGSRFAVQLRRGGGTEGRDEGEAAK